MTRPYPDERLEIAVQALEEIRNNSVLPLDYALNAVRLARKAADVLREIERLTALAPKVCG